MKLTRIFDLFDWCKDKYPKPDTLAHKTQSTIKKYSIDDFSADSQKVACAFLSFQVEKGDRIVTIIKNRPEWNIIEMGIALIGGIHVPVNTEMTDNQIDEIIIKTEPRIIFVEDNLIFKKIATTNQKIAAKIISFENIENTDKWEDIIKIGKNNSNLSGKVSVAKDSVKSDNVLSINYFADNEGKLHGVMLTHRNFMTNIQDSADSLNLGKDDNALIFNHLSNISDRLMCYLFMYHGVSVYYAQMPEYDAKIVSELEINSLHISSQQLQNFYEQIIKKSEDLTGFAKMFYKSNKDLLHEYDLNSTYGFLQEKKLDLVKNSILSCMKEIIGNNVKILICISQGLQSSIVRFFWACGMPLQEGFGLPEAASLISFNFSQLPNLKLDTSGSILKSAKIMIDQNGEIFCKGPNVMKGYYNEDELSKQKIDDDRWLHTGIKGKIIDENFIKID